jgi:hypothetical protein
MPRDPAVDLARTLVDATRKHASRVHAPWRTDIGSVTDTAPVVIELQDSGIDFDQDDLFFASGCPPQSLRRGDNVLVAAVEGEYIVLDRIEVGPRNARQTPLATPPGLLAFLGEDADLPDGWIRCRGQRTPEDEDALFEVYGPRLPEDPQLDGLVMVVRT